MFTGNSLAGIPWWSWMKLPGRPQSLCSQTCVIAQCTLNQWAGGRTRMTWELPLLKGLPGAVPQSEAALGCAFCAWLWEAASFVSELSPLFPLSASGGLALAVSTMGIRLLFPPSAA